MHPENSKKWIEDARLHTPLPHLYNLQGKNRRRICSLQEADMGENQTTITLAKGNKPQDEPKKVAKQMTRKVQKGCAVRNSVT